MSRCFICDSKLHWADQGPLKNDSASAFVAENNGESDDENSEKVNIALMTKEVKEIEVLEVFVEEVSKSAMANAACTKTVAGQIWFKNFKSNLNEQTLKEIKTFPSNTSFKFGDSRNVKSLYWVIFLDFIANKHCKVNSKIVPGNIPLLLSKASLDNCSTIINMNEEKVKIFWPTFTPNPHQQVLVLETNLPHKEKLSQIKKNPESLDMLLGKSWKNF